MSKRSFEWINLVVRNFNESHHIKYIYLQFYEGMALTLNEDWPVVSVTYAVHNFGIRMI
jgi:hypothetical protein